MPHFAQVIDGFVTQVLVIDQENIDTGLWGDPATWVQTSYNTRGGVYYVPGTNIPHEDQSKAFRKNFAGVGYRWDADRDAFIPPQPFPSWVLDEFSCTWSAPVPYPTDVGTPEDPKVYVWDEATTSWKLAEMA